MVEEIKDKLEKHFYSWDIESFPIDMMHGVGIEVEYKNKKYISVGQFEDGYRIATFDVTSWVDSGIGVHYYGRLHIDTSMEDLETGWYTFVGGMEIPTECKDINIEFKRPIKEFELKNGTYDPRFFNMNSYVTGFYNEEELIDLLKDTVNYLLKGKWKIKCSYWRVDDEEIIVDN